LGLTLDISRMTFDDAFFARMAPAADKALADMDALERGTIANPDEGRMVGHYWLRAPHLAPTPQLRDQIESALASGICSVGGDVLLCGRPWAPCSSPTRWASPAATRWR
jgi:glucose-6-phosphate isomerase